MQDYQPNSHKYKMEQAAKNDERRVEKVVTGKVKIKKKSGISKFADTFISEDAANVKSYIFLDVLVPAIKKAISDIVTDGIDMILYGGSGRSKKRSSGSNATYVSYRSYSDDRRDRRDDRDDRRVRSMYDFEQFTFDTMDDAMDVLDSLDDIIDTYDSARVADFYELIGKTCPYTGNNYGWTNLSGVKPERVRVDREVRWVLPMPNPKPIKN